MNSAINEIHKAFEKAGLKHDVQEIAGKAILFTGMTGNSSTYRFFFVKEGDIGNDVALRIHNISHCSKSQVDRAREVLNKLQLQYRFLRFTIDDDGDINGEYDFPTTYEDIGKGAVEMCLRLVLLLDQCASKLKALD